MTAGRQGYRFAPEDVRFLSSPAGDDALLDAARFELSDRSLLADLTALQKRIGGNAAAVAETVRLRRRAVPKFGPGAAAWLLTESALQQGTPAAVAEHRARRLAGIGLHDLTCSIGADLSVLAARGDGEVVIGSDLDPVRTAMAGVNLRAAGSAARVFLADALTVTSRGLLGYADPARRDAGGRRITSVDTIPSVADLDAVHAHRPPVLRLPPGVDYDRLDRPGEVEIVSLDGTAREAVLWPVELARVARRATVLRSVGPTEQLTSADPDGCQVGGVQALIVDPDPAVIRAGLVRQYGARHGLRQLDPHLAYLTGATAPPGTRAFTVLDHGPFAEKLVAGWIRRDGIGTLEIKQRGTPVIPDELRLRLRPALTRDTTAAATLIVARVGRSAVAYWCRAQPALFTGAKQ